MKSQTGVLGRLRYSANGTGRTSGHIATLYVYNPTPGAIRTAVGDCFIPSDKDYQGYVVLNVYPVEIGPFGSVSVDLEGYCVNVHRPAVPDGETMTDVSHWVSWAAGDPLPVPGQAPGAGFVRMPAAPLGDPLSPTFPGSNEPFLYTIDFNRYPRAAARLLLHAAYAAETVYDALNKDGKIQTVSGRERRAEIVQQALWAYTARLEGRNYEKAIFSAQFNEEVEQSLNRPQTSFSSETKQQTEQVSNDIWSNIELVGTSAKLIPPQTNRTGDSFKEIPAGPPANPAELLPGLVEAVAPNEKSAANSLIPLLLFFQNNPATPALQTLQQTTVQKWDRYLEHYIGRLAPENSGALPELLEVAGLLQSAAGRLLAPTVLQRLSTNWNEKLNNHVRHVVASLSSGDPAYLDKWRKLKSWPATHWYRIYCAAANPIQKLPPYIPAGALKTGTAGTPNLAGISLANARWKHFFPVKVAAGPRKFPRWIPVAGIPVLGGGLYFLLRDKDGGKTPLPEPPLTMPDAVSLPCGNMTELNVLANDSGDGIILVAVNGTPGISVSLMDQQHVLVISAGDGAFTVNYTIRDNAGQTATGAIIITVTDLGPPDISCPAAVTFEGCGQDPAPAPTFSGQAGATDDCDPAPAVHFTDEPGGTPCNRVFVRTWSAVDKSGKTASCSQIITVTDQSIPVFSFCPPAATVPFGQQNNLALTGQAEANDACSGALSPVFADDLSDFGDCGGAILRTWTATDPCGSTTTCMQTVTVKDETPPEINCPAAVSVECGKQYDLNLTGRAEAKDDCAGTLTSSYTDSPPAFSGCAGTILRTWAATDPGGNTVNCVQEITVADKSAPVFTVCPPATSVPCGQQNDLNLTGMAQAQDACNSAAAPTFTDNNSGFNGCSGVIVRTFLTADSCGNTATCQQAVTVSDNTPPVFTNCPPPVFVNCGQENVLEITGQATATDACSGNAAISFTDDTDEFSACNGLIIRNWVATDQCGNTALCQQFITVTEAPCGFTPFFAIGNATCGNCNGSVSTAVNPAGTYTFQWENGAAGPNLSGLCPGAMSVSVTDQTNHCTNIYTISIEDIQIELTLTIVNIIPPSSPSANDGRVVLQVTTPGVILPFLVFVNGNPIGTANTTTFTITNMPPGIYEIWVVDNNGQGCMSNVVVAELFPQEPPGVAGPVEIQILPGYSNPEVITAPELPAGAPAQNPVLWSPPLTATFGLDLGRNWQLRWSFGRQMGYLANPARPATLESVRYAAGLRRYIQMGKRWSFFQETGFEFNRIDGTAGHGGTSNSDFWRTRAGGGLRWRLPGGYALNWETNLFIQHEGQIFSKKRGVHFSSQIQFAMPFSRGAKAAVSIR